MPERPRPSRPRRSASPSISPAALGPVRVGADFAEEFPDGDATSAELLATLVRLGTAATFEIERAMVTTFDAPQTTLNALAVIEGAEQPLTPSQISERMLVSSATMTATLDALEYRGWVRRTPNPEDRRSVLVEITADGRAVVDRLLPGIRRIEQSAFADLTPRERTTMLALATKLLGALASMAEDPPIVLDGRRNSPRRPATND